MLSTRWETHTSCIWWTKEAIFIWFEKGRYGPSNPRFELRPPSTLSIGSHPSTPGPCYWHSFFCKFNGSVRISPGQYNIAQVLTFSLSKYVLTVWHLSKCHLKGGPGFLQGLSHIHYSLVHCDSLQGKQRFIIYMIMLTTFNVIWGCLTLNIF